MGTHKPSLPLKKPCDISHQSVSRPSIINTFKKIVYSEVFYEIVDFFVLDVGSKTYILLKNYSKTQNLFLAARTAKSCSKRQMLLKSCRAQSANLF